MGLGYRAAELGGAGLQLKTELQNWEAGAGLQLQTELQNWEAGAGLLLSIHYLTQTF